MKRYWIGLAAGFLLTVTLSAASPARAQRIVYDPTNYAQNLLAASRALEQVRNQIAQIEQGAAMLRQNPLQLSPELSQSLADARRLFDTARGLQFQVESLGEDLRTLYPETWEEYDLSQVLSRSQAWTRESRASLERAMAAEARASEALEATRRHVDRALASSANAEGQTGAIQASNQLLGVQAAQLAQLQALLIAQGRALQTERMERRAREERALEIQRRAFPTGHASDLTPARTAF